MLIADTLRPLDENSLEVEFSDIAAEWDYIQNQLLTPEMMYPKSGRRVWWKCAKGHSWQSRIADRTSVGCNCPKCFGKEGTEDSNLKVIYPEIALLWDNKVGRVIWTL